MDWIGMRAVIGGKRYDTRTATLLASDSHWDGSNYERHGRNTFLFRAPRGSYFVQHRTLWDGEQDGLEPMTPAEAVDLFESLPEKYSSFGAAFPSVAVEDA